MSRVLVVDDEPEQLMLRRLILERDGHEVRVAGCASEALQVAGEYAPEVLLMDLGLPEVKQGMRLIRDLRERRFDGRIIVLTGWPEQLYDTPEAGVVEQILPKPVATAELLAAIRRAAMALCCVLLCFLPALAESFPFQVTRDAEVVAEMEMSSPGSDWSQKGREAALADVAVDGRVGQHIMLFAGETRYTYTAFLGTLVEGAHQLSLERDARYSAAGSQLRVHGVRFRQVKPDDPGHLVLAHAPILYARADTVGAYSDTPLLAYCERLTENGRPLLQYTTIFSNEDGGTSTRALMARWGRTADIEYIYKAWLDAKGQVERETIQAKDHKEIEFRGRHEGSHPVLIPSTRNNMVSPDGVSPLRFQLPPELVDLSTRSREEVMYRHPLLYRVTAQELAREGKLRPPGTAEGEKISDPRNYLYAEMKVANRDSAVGALVRLKDETVWRASDLGRSDYAISRDGWVQTTIELPPGTAAARIAEYGFSCVVPKKELLSGDCRVEAVGRVFQLDSDYRPGPSLWQLTAGFSLPTGQMRTFKAY